MSGITIEYRGITYLLVRSVKRVLFSNEKEHIQSYRQNVTRDRLATMVEVIECLLVHRCPLTCLVYK